MVIHKRTRLTPLQRQQIYKAYFTDRIRVSDLAREYHVSRPTIYKILERGRKRDFSVHKSTNKRYRCLKYGIKRLSKIERQLEEKLKRQALRYNKDYPGQMIHGDTKRLPLLEGQSTKSQREYLFVAIDDFSRELFAAILPDKTQHSAQTFLEQVIDECAYTIEQYYTDNGKEYRGDPDHHAFMVTCQQNKIEQRFTKIKRPRTNGKAERVLRTIMEMWHNKTRFSSSAHRKTELKRFVNFYNSVKPHKAIDGMTPMEKLLDYFYPEEL
jgi:transposase InsO family protein